MNSSKKVALIGGGGHASSLLAFYPEPEGICGYVDFTPGAAVDCPYLCDDPTFLRDFSPEDYEILVTYVSGSDCSLKNRRKIIELYKNYTSPVVVAPTAWVAPTSQIEGGAMIMTRAVVNANVRIGAHSVVNTGAIVEHDCRIGSNVFIGPGAVLCGAVEVEPDAYIGAGAVIRPGVKICSGAMIGLGTVIGKDIKEPGTYFGIPARKIS